MRDDQPDTPVPGDLIWIRRRQWRVTSTHAGRGLTRVVVDGWADGWADTGSTAERRTFLLPCEPWSRDVARRSRVVSRNRALAWLAACAARAVPAFTPGSIVNSQTSLLAYQLEPALAMLAGKRRVLIADTVGLGKTIQAALIIAETLRRGEDSRVLVMAPASLLTQWRGELLERFGVPAQVADADSFTRLRSDRRYLSNPWQTPGVWLTSPDYVKQPHVIDGMPQMPFDLVVIDEAHMMAGTSQRHSAADAIARSARQVVLLTATPHDGDHTRFRRLVSLGATESPADALTIFRRTRTGHARHVRTVDVDPGTGLSRVLSAIDSFERVRRFGDASDGLLLICGVFRKRALSSLAALAASLDRRLALVNTTSAAVLAEPWTQPGLNFGDATAGPDDGDVMPADEWSALSAATGLSQARERAWLERLVALTNRVRSGPGDDPKLARLSCLLGRAREPVVVFTEYRDSLLALAGALAGSRCVSILHGGLPGSEQRRALESFLHGDADVLLATDVASQGLNLQHRARWVVHFDVPWTPMRLEQRVGRVDRIGQTRTVHVTAIGVRHPAQEALRQRVVARQDARDSTPLDSCTRWTRGAEGLARWFGRQRALATRWRGPDFIALPRARVTASTLRRLGLEEQAELPGECRHAQPELRTLVEIPLVTGTGAIVERHLGWLAGDGAPTVLVRRARALTSRAQRRLARLDAAQATPARGAPRQPGLFDARDLMGPRPVGVDDSAAMPIASGVTVRVGRPRVILLLDCAIHRKDRRA